MSGKSNLPHVDGIQLRFREMVKIKQKTWPDHEYTKNKLFISPSEMWLLTFAENMNQFQPLYG